jgi:tRNA(Leu) C34 or U34 (ribose-2'-O)-methylase TrmL
MNYQGCHKNADRAFPARHPPEHRDHPQALCLPECGSPHHRTRRLAKGYRLILFTTKGATPYLDFGYGASDILLFGRETAGVTDEAAAAADARLVIPIKPSLRSLNVAMAAAMAVGEALRQTRENA